MRYIVYGVGAVGGVVAAALTRAGQEVIGIARGARLAALQEGMTLRSPAGTTRVRFACVGQAAEIGLRPDDTVILTVKGQDTAAALADLRGAGLEDQPVFCAQNGVANERAALRLFPNVHGINVMLPAEYMSPGETIACCSPDFGVLRHRPLSAGDRYGGRSAGRRADAGRDRRASGAGCDGVQIRQADHEPCQHRRSGAWP